MRVWDVHLRLTCDRFALGGYAIPMKVNPVRNCTLVIRSQAEFSAATQTVIMRCILELPATGQRRGFSDVDALLTALRAELTDMQRKIVPPELKEE